MKLRTFLKRWLPLITIVLLTFMAFVAGLHEKITLEALQQNREELLTAVSERPFASVFSFMGIYIVFAALSLPAATLLTLTGGFLFGKLLGTLYVVTAATAGATIVFLIARTSLGQSLRKKAGSLYRRIESNMNDNAAGYLLFLRLVPIFPFFLVNIIPALFNVRLHVYVLTTFFGIIPGTFVYVNLGAQLGEIDRLKDIASGETLVAFGLLGLFVLLPTLYRQFRAKEKKEKDDL